ncbi:MAG: hypothetical protein NUW22_13030 [Acidobacteria bacterium]|nr:hypothetical protein [Acidobacteriota bacterium]
MARLCHQREDLITPWLANLSVTAYCQRTARLLENLLPVQFPAPAAVRFFPIAVRWRT